MPNDPAAREARRFLDQLQAYRLKRWGKTDLEKQLDTIEERPVSEIFEEVGKRHRRELT